MSCSRVFQRVPAFLKLFSFVQTSTPELKTENIAWSCQLLALYILKKRRNGKKTQIDREVTVDVKE